MRQTIYIPSHGYITKDDEFEYVGNGFLEDAIKVVKDVVTSKAAKDIAIKAGKTFAETAGKKLGEKTADKIITKVFSDKKKDIKDKSTIIINPIKTNSKESKSLLSKIYGDGLFRQSGKGLRYI